MERNDALNRGLLGSDPAFLSLRRRLRLRLELGMCLRQPSPPYLHLLTEDARLLHEAMSRDPDEEGHDKDQYDLGRKK